MAYLFVLCALAHVLVCSDYKKKKSVTSVHTKPLSKCSEKKKKDELSLVSGPQTGSLANFSVLAVIRYIVNTE